jgi:ubiquitin-activating enzyme E1
MNDFVDFDKPKKLHDLYMHYDGFMSIGENDLLESFKNTYLYEFTPINSIIGGICSLEAIKGLTHKYTPINQYYYYSALELYNENDFVSIELDRYYNQINLIGTQSHNKILNSKYFVVGAGAIGCELLKNFAMIGLGCGPDGYIKVTDMDTIERSNLNRQFLFRPNDIGKSKSECASHAVKVMNSDINIINYNNYLGPSTEDIFNHNFYKDLDGIANALDNVEARKYVDTKAIFYDFPVIDSGTVGTKCSVQVIKPYETTSYNSNRDSDDGMIPICTVKNFPYRIDHTIQWAKVQFEELFSDIPKILLKVQSGEIIEDYEEDKIELIKDRIPETLEECIDFMIKKFDYEYNIVINELLEEYPEDKLNDDGTQFWTGSDKRMPKPIIYNEHNKLHTDYVDNGADILMRVINNNFREEVFEKDDDSNAHIDFITNASNLRAMNYNIKPIDRYQTKKIAGRIIPALATTTSVVAGLVTIEIIKLILNNRNPINSFCNIGLGLYQHIEPQNCTSYMINDVEYNIWSKFKYDNVTLNEIVDDIESKGLEIDFISNCGEIIYSDLFENDNMDNLIIDPIVLDLSVADSDCIISLLVNI